VNAALCRRFGWDTGAITAHKEWCGPGTICPGRKVDPFGPIEDGANWGPIQGRIDDFRGRVFKRLIGATTLTTENPPTEENDDMNGTATVWSSESQFDVFKVGKDGALWHRWYVEGTGWLQWESLGGQLASAPSATTSKTGAQRIDVTAVGTDGAVWHIWYDGAWSAWESLGQEP
jgi:hypothetical protein